MWKTLSRSLLLLTMSFYASTAHAEIRMESSLEWLCAEADVVVVGQLTEVKDLRGQGKSEGLVGLTLKVDTNFKGDDNG